MDPRVPHEAPALAQRLADAARPILQGYYRQPIPVDGKADDSPVTRADREAEAAIRAVLSKAAPDHGIVGEEHGREQADAEYVWVIDPIDGTRAFISGKPQFGTLIGLAHRGQPVLGLIDMPILGERWMGVLGVGTTLNGQPVRTRKACALHEARIGTTTLEMYESEEERATYGRLRAAVADCNFGGDCYNYAIVAGGWLDMVIETGLQPWDYMALAPVVEAAGGKMTDWSGRPLDMNASGDVIAASDPSLLRAALDVIAPK